MKIYRLRQLDAHLPQVFVMNIEILFRKSVTRDVETQQ